MKRKKRKILNTILERLVVINLLSFLVMATAIESNSYIPIVIMVINLVSVLFFGILRG